MDYYSRAAQFSFGEPPVFSAGGKLSQDLFVETNPDQLFGVGTSLLNTEVHVLPPGAPK